MFLAIIGWQDFQMRFLKTAEQVFAFEEESRWLFYSQSGIILVKCVVDKSDDRARNASFVDRYLNNINIIKMLDYKEGMQFNFGLVKQE